MQVELNYGRRSLPVELPSELQVTVVRKPVMPVLTDPVAAVWISGIRQSPAEPYSAWIRRIFAPHPA